MMTAGFDGFYSSNEDGRRGSVSLGLSSRRVAVSFTGGTERFGDYRAGKNFRETSQPFYDSGRIDQADTIDDPFGFRFNRFPDPFNAPFTRTSAIVSNSGMQGSSANLAAAVRLSANQTVEVKYQRRRAENVGFPDFIQPAFFQNITLPWSQHDKVSATYAATNVTPWLTKLRATVYYQKQDRLLHNDFPVQFPVPTAVTFFPITVFRLNILSDTRQQVATPGVELQATFLTHPNNVLTAGVTIFSDRSEDERTTSTTTTQIGRVALGQFGPAATVFAAPIVLGPADIQHPTRVPNARFRDTGLFLHDEWTASSDVRLTAGLRVDGYRVTTENTPGYDIEQLIAGAVPAIGRATLPNVAGDKVTRTAFTGEAGVVIRPDHAVSLFGHYARSYRHANLEELLFSGPATTGNIVPNVTVKPEKGHNLDVGTRLRFAKFTGSLSYFNNTYRDFISTEIVARLADGDSVSQAINLARVRIQGVEAEGTAPFVTGAADVAALRERVVQPRHGARRLDAALGHVARRRAAGQHHAVEGRGWPARRRTGRSGGGRVTASARQPKVTRVSPLLEDSEFLIAQDLFGLGGVLHSSPGPRLRLAEWRTSPRSHPLSRQPHGRVLPRALPVRPRTRTVRVARAEDSRRTLDAVSEWV